MSRYRSRHMTGKRLIQSQLSDLMKNPMDDVSVTPSDDNKKVWIVTISASSQDYFPYTGGTFVIEFLFGKQYPYNTKDKI